VLTKANQFLTKDKEYQGKREKFFLNVCVSDNIWFDVAVNPML
jgi:hypothetical protein